MNATAQQAVAQHSQGTLGVQIVIFYVHSLHKISLHELAIEILQVHTANGRRINVLYHCNFPRWQSRGNVCDFTIYNALTIIRCNGALSPATMTFTCHTRQFQAMAKL